MTTTPTPTDLPEALRIISEWPITDPGNMDAANMAALARAALSAAAPAVAPALPTLDTLPGWDELMERVDTGQPLTPLEQFIYDHEEADPENIAPWRAEVLALVQHYAAPAPPQAGASARNLDSAALVSMRHLLATDPKAHADTVIRAIDTMLAQAGAPAVEKFIPCNGSPETALQMAAVIALRDAAPQAGAESFPPMPEPTYNAGGPDFERYYNAAQMRAYATAALRARGAVPSDVLIQSVEEFIGCYRAKYKNAGNNGFRTNAPLYADVAQLNAGLVSVRNATSTAPQPPAALPGEQDARDAARYRLVRRGQHWSVVDGIGDHLRGDELDAAVDAKLARRAKGGAA